ncbi:Pyruvate kinase, cytosolic isozyme [Triticum urartu]|uniref:pyruvate kinase n=1 Tax=Triticum urartu TaxID=4572 RepID=M7ZRH4_TRIUA|nr:Pyruvate kinase, cytosolic isozyme [Triticum urartu]
MPTLSDEDKDAREFLSKLGDLSQTLIFAKIENVEGLNHFDEILEEAEKSALHKCNKAGKPVVVTRVVDSMTDNLRPSRVEATDVAHAVLDGSDAILLSAETLRGLYPVETMSTVGRICAEAEVFNQDLYFKRTMKYVGEPMTHLESIASSAARQSLIVRGLFPMLADPRHPAGIF